MEDSYSSTTGHRGNLTSSQTRDLLQLWHRFLQLCEDHPFPTSPTANLDTQTPSTLTSDSLYLQSNQQSSRIPTHQNGDLSPPREPLDPTSSPSTAPSSANASGEKVGEIEGFSPLSKKMSMNDLASSSNGPQAQASSAIPQNQRSFSSRLNTNSSRTRGALMRSASANLSHHQVSSSAPHSHQPNSAALGKSIPRDDKIKDQVRGLEEAKELRNFLIHHGGIKLKEVFWSMVKGEHPDALLLRILRARKWDVDRALGVLGSTAAFRLENDVAGINSGGEASITQTKGGQKIFRNGIAYVWGATTLGEPIYYIEVGNHFGSNQTQEELKRAIILSHEHLIDLMPPPVERCVVVFNMNHFGLRNMDWWAVFFLVKTVEAYYPESLTRIYVHGAPWFFKPIWIILRPLLDPIVRDKVRLTSSVEELEDHIPWTHLPKNSMFGGMEWDYVYPEPEEDENHLLRDIERRDHLQANFNEVANEFEVTTRALLNSYVRARTRIRNRGPQSSAARSSSTSRRSRNPAPRNEELDLDSDAEHDNQDRGVEAVGTNSEGSDEELDGNDAASTPSTTKLLARRDVLATKLRVAWLELRPYIWAKSKYDRWGITQDDGTIRWTYPSADGQDEVQILGEGVSIPELKRGLEIIERSQQRNNDAMMAEASSSGKGSARRRDASNGVGNSSGIGASSTAAAAALPTMPRPSRASQKRSRIAATLAAAQATQHKRDEDDARSSFDENETYANEAGNMDLASAAAAAAGLPSKGSSSKDGSDQGVFVGEPSNFSPQSTPTNGSSSDRAPTYASESTARPLHEESETSTTPSPPRESSSRHQKQASSSSAAKSSFPVHPLEGRSAKAENSNQS